MNGHYTIRAATVSIFRWSPSVLGWWTSHLLHPVRRDRAHVLSLGSWVWVHCHQPFFISLGFQRLLFQPFDLGPWFRMPPDFEHVRYGSLRLSWCLPKGLVRSRYSWQMMKRPLWRHDVILRMTYDVILPKIEVACACAKRICNACASSCPTVPIYSKINGNARIRTLDLEL